MQSDQEKANPALPAPVDAQLIEAAQPFVFKSNYSKGAMEIALGEYWQLLASDLPELYEAKTQKPPPEELTPDLVYEAWGGKWPFYHPMLHDALMRDLSDAAWPREPLYTTNFDVLELEDSYMLSCLVYFVPKAYFQEGGPKKIHVHGIDPVDDAQVQAEVDRRMAQMQATQSMEREKQGVIEEGDMAVCSVTPRIDGELWAAGATKKAPVHILKERLQPLELYEKLLGLGVGNHKLSFTLPSKFGPLSGKQVEADVVVHAVLTYVLPEWSDDLAQRVGKWKTYGELLEATQFKAREVFVEQWEGRVADAALAALTQQLKFDPLPSDWVEMKANEQFRKLKGRARGDEMTVAKSLGAPTVEIARLNLYEASRREAQAVVALLAYGEAVGLDRKRDESLGNLSAFLRRSVKHLIDCNTVVCHDE